MAVHQKPSQVASLKIRSHRIHIPLHHLHFNDTLTTISLALQFVCRNGFLGQFRIQHNEGSLPSTTFGPRATKKKLPDDRLMINIQKTLYCVLWGSMKTVQAARQRKIGYTAWMELTYYVVREDLFLLFLFSRFEKKATPC